MLLALIFSFSLKANANIFDTRSYRASVTCASLLRAVQSSRAVVVQRLDRLAEELHSAGFELGALYLTQNRFVAHNPVVITGIAEIGRFVADVQQWEVFYKENGFDRDLTNGNNLALIWALGLTLAKMVSPHSIANEIGHLIKNHSGNGRIRAEKIDFSLRRLYARTEMFLTNPTQKRSLRIALNVPDSVFNAVVNGDSDHLANMQEFNGYELAPKIFKMWHEAELTDLMNARRLTPEQQRQFRLFLEPRRLEFDFWFYQNKDGIPSLAVIAFRPDRIEAPRWTEEKLRALGLDRIFSHP